MADEPRKFEIIEIPEQLAAQMDKIAGTGVFGSDRHEVVTHILRAYLWSFDSALHNIGACPAFKCRHGD